jgi:hypothetical protein
VLTHTKVLFRSCWQDVLQRIDRLSYSSTTTSTSSASITPPAIDRDETSCAFWSRGDYHEKYGARATLPHYLEDSNGDLLSKDWIV